MERRYWTTAELSELWARRRHGEPLSRIGARFGRPHQAVVKVLRRSGGIAPPVRRRAARVLRREEREEISRGLAAGLSYRAMSQQLSRACSTVSREVSRHGGRTGYRAEAADVRAWRNAQRPKACRLATCPRLRRCVAAKLAANWSPEQIAGWLQVTYADDPRMQVSHETIYRSLFVQSRGVLRKSLAQHLRRPRTMRRSRPSAALRGPLADAVSIRERPATVEDRAVPGHWEGDLLAGTIDSHVATLVERQSRYLLLVRIPSKDTTQVVRALARQIRTVPQQLRRSLTWDRGRELTAHRAFTVATDVQVYFCDPHSPWQRGSNENTNGLLRQYLPRGTNLATYSQADFNRIARQLNQRPRKTLGFKTPADMLASIVASTG
jgi:IS30 family transposase